LFNESVLFVFFFPQPVSNQSNFQKLSTAGLLVSLGIVYGDIGTSPLYTLRAIFNTVHESGQAITPMIVLGALSCIIWTLTLQTTIKYVVITLRADNKGEGGIFSLYSLVRKKAKWLVIPAIIGGCALLADGIITPSITVTTAIEGLQFRFPQVSVIPIVIAIITALFIIQQFGTSLVGKLFGPIMFLWFTTLGFLGAMYVFQDLSILKALNPYYAVHLIATNPLALVILGGVFLCTTGAEALYSDLGHCGRANIRVSWVFVKVTLILNYLGQGVWLLQHPSYNENLNPFYQIVPEPYLLSMVALATLAAIIASQAMITGSFTLITEAVRLNIWPRVLIAYPSNHKGQIYVPSINWLLCIGCISVVMLFKKSVNMEGAYGLAINLTFLATTILISYFMKARKVPMPFIIMFLGIYGILELSFLAGNMTKFLHGGFVTLLIGASLFTVMWAWFNARKIRNRFVKYVGINDYFEILTELSEDESVPKYTSQLAYLTGAEFKTEIESKIIYSILQKEPKRADIYWLIHVDTVDEPFTRDYKVEFLIPGKLIRIDFRLGFRVEHAINLLFRKVIEELVSNGEVDITSQYRSLRKHKIAGDFRFILLEKHLSRYASLNFYERTMMQYYLLLKKISLSQQRSFGLDSSYVDVEKVPLIFVSTDDLELNRLPV
jgi:KUP system potassium uptake protein